jgi:hypothetical protein
MTKWPTAATGGPAQSLNSGLSAGIGHVDSVQTDVHRLDGVSWALRRWRWCRQEMVV